MKITVLIVTLLSFATSIVIGEVAAVEPSKLSDNLPQYSKVYDDERDPFKDAKAAIERAQSTGRNVLIEIGGNWCAWCHKMDAFLADNPDIYQQLHENFVLLKVNVSDSNENEEFMKGLPPVLGYPHIYVSTAQGKMLLSKDTAELLDNGNYSRDAWLGFLKAWQTSKDNTDVTQNAQELSASNNRTAIN